MLFRSGYRDKNAFIVIATDGEYFYVIDEDISGEITTSELAENIKKLEDYWNIDMIYIDSAAQQLRADFAGDYDIYCENAIKSVNDGINFLCALIDHNKLIFDRDHENHDVKWFSIYKLPFIVPYQYHLIKKSVKQFLKLINEKR